MKKIINDSIFKAASITGINNIIKKLKVGATALIYHGVETKIIDARIQELHLPFKEFEKQINYLRKNFEIISLDYLYDCLSNGHKIDPFQVVITFDDGYKNIINIVEPYLRSLNIPFSVFICTNHIDKGSRFPTYYLRSAILYTDQRYINILSINKTFDISTPKKRIYAKNIIENYLKTCPQNVVNLIVKDLIELIPQNRWTEINDIFSSDEPMNWKDIEKLHYSGITIGSHCHDHCILHPNQKREEVDYQLKTSKDIIEEHLGECKYVAYPDGGRGNFSFDALKKVKKYKYYLGFTAVKGEICQSSNPFILPRLGISFDFNHFKFNINSSFRYKKRYFNWSSKFNKPLD